MNEYHKIQTVFLRDPANNHRTLLDGQWAKPEFELLANVNWRFDEKIDGTNIRVIWDESQVRFGGKTDNAQIPAFLLNRLQDLFPPDRISEIAKGPLTLHGEGFGAKIQKGGGNYIPDGVDFILFDVFAGGVWLERAAVEEIASQIGCRMVPTVGFGTLRDAVEMAQEGFKSSIGTADAEGLVMRPYVELLDRRGHRVISKVKHKDFSA